MWFDDIGHVRGHLNLWILKLYKILLKERIFHWDLKFLECSTHEIHKIKCPTNKNDYTVYFHINMVNKASYLRLLTSFLCYMYLHIIQCLLDFIILNCQGLPYWYVLLFIISVICFVELNFIMQWLTQLPSYLSNVIYLKNNQSCWDQFLNLFSCSDCLSVFIMKSLIKSNNFMPLKLIF